MKWNEHNTKKKTTKTEKEIMEKFTWSTIDIFMQIRCVVFAAQKGLIYPLLSARMSSAPDTLRRCDAATPRDWVERGAMSNVEKQ